MTVPKKSPKPGDWIRFYQGGALVLGVVAYVRKDDIDGHAIVCADCGEIDPDDVLEIRPAPEVPHVK